MMRNVLLMGHLLPGRRYDLTGVPPDKLALVLRHDWGRLVVHKRLLNSPNYLREQGRPVIGLKGIGIKGAYQDPAMVLDIIRQLKTFTPGGAYVVAGGKSVCLRLKRR